MITVVRNRSQKAPIPMPHVISYGTKFDEHKFIIIIMKSAKFGYPLNLENIFSGTSLKNSRVISFYITKLMAPTYFHSLFLGSVPTFLSPCALRLPHMLFYPRGAFSIFKKKLLDVTFHFYLALNPVQSMVERILGSCR